MYRYSEEERKFFEEFVPGHSFKEIADEHNKRFKNAITDLTVKSYCNNHKLRTGTQTKFQKGHISFNKGKKGYYAKGCEKGWFKKGNIPYNHKEVGCERISKDGYIEIKIAEPNKWKLKHRIIYEKENGPIPEGMVVTFLDGNKLNIDISNLALVTLADNARLNQNGLRSKFPELTKTGITIAKIQTAMGKREVKK